MRTAPSKFLSVALIVAMVISSLSAPWPVSAVEVPGEKLDCRVYDVKTSKLGMGLKVGAMAFSLLFGLATGPAVSVTPQITYDKKSGIEWDRAVHGIIARYVELCNRYNAGLVNKTEYETRLRDIDTLYEEAKKVEAKLIEGVEAHMRAADRELDEAVGKAPAATPTSGLDASIQQLLSHVEQLDPIGKPLTPAPPCPTPDMLGAPGRSC